ncbi:TonB-dependent receptor plug domain-containing protein [Flavobacterium tegetincola]|uniref:TonB-dependent receptor plug domain-containing protein n=1 Tax=Flavobacterium tegetincola TaxID=150172 RepID=UPI0003FECD11|nr:TonB-dependent receptor [Flavobacterium tegetincola]
MTLRYFIFLFGMLVCQKSLAQTPVAVQLDEVDIADRKLRDYSNAQNVQQLNDSIIQKNQPSLTSLLNFSTGIYFKENGLGMVSSPSFRGTTAQQTAVVWNGININSQLNGQTDFNTISTSDFNSISVRAGGGSSLYGTSAIGGSIHLNTTLNFRKLFSNRLNVNYGSYNTLTANYQVKYATEKMSFFGSVSRNSSDNNYDYLNSNRTNLNGQFYNSSYNVGFGYKINSRNTLKLYSQFFDGERHFSLINPTDSKTKYRDFNTRNLADLTTYLGNFTSNLKVGFLSEEYKYFGNIAQDNFTFGKVETLLAKYNLNYRINAATQVDFVADFTQNKGDGSDIATEKRSITGFALQFKQSVNEHFSYDWSLRKEVTNNYKSPLLYAVGTVYKPFKWYTLKANFSQNFRIPTFNDLYWQGAGNIDLQPEKAVQGEIGNVFQWQNFSITATVFYSKIKDMIRWLPQNGGVFRPTNTERVSIFGSEISMDYSKVVHKHHFDFHANYSYTDSENEKTGKQLTFVPFHKTTASLAYSYSRFAAFYQYLFNGEVFTQTDNNPKKIIENYTVSNFGISADLDQHSNYTLGFKVLNLWNENYESVENRPLPGRNYALNLTLNF